MSTDSQPGSEAITRIDRPPSAVRPTSPEICQACLELTARVEHLERALALREETGSSEQIGTTTCYWSCVGAHALMAFMLFMSAQSVQPGLVLCVGAMATLVICQVFSTRPIHLRVLRTLLSASVVAVAAMLGMSLGDVADPSDVAPFLLVCFPPIFAAGWFVAKMFVWIRGWRIVAPGYSSQYPRLQIQHLLLCTFFFAAYLAAGQLMELNIDEGFDAGLSATLLYLGIPLIVGVSVSSLLARIVLSRPSERVVVRVLWLAFLSTLFLALICLAIVPLLTRSTMNWEAMFGLFVYMAPLGVGVFASSGGTFAMMRLAGYRFASEK